MRIAKGSDDLRHAAIQFQFADETSAHLAYETLQELGYEAVKDNARATELHIHVENQDLASALEIAGAYGGMLQEQKTMQELPFEAAYAVQDCIAIPAHVVNEDWADGYAEGVGALRDMHAAEAEASVHEQTYAWTEDSTNHFSGDIKA